MTALIRCQQDRIPRDRRKSLTDSALPAWRDFASDRATTSYRCLSTRTAAFQGFRMHQ